MCLAVFIKLDIGELVESVKDAYRVPRFDAVKKQNNGATRLQTMHCKY